MSRVKGWKLRMQPCWHALPCRTFRECLYEPLMKAEASMARPSLKERPW